MLRMFGLLCVAVAVALAGCSGGEGGKDDEVTVKPVVKTEPYKPKPGETVVSFKFNDPSRPDTESGTVYIRLFPDEAPRTCDHIIKLIDKMYYNGILIHRVELKKDFQLIQWGDAATKDGTVDPSRPQVGSGATVPLESTTHKHVPGAVGLARSDAPDSGDAQIYICFTDIPSLDGKYCVFGQVVQGLEFAEKLALKSKVVDAQVVQDARPGHEKTEAAPADKPEETPGDRPTEPPAPAGG